MGRWAGWAARIAGGWLLIGLTACGGPAALTPLQTQYQREAERALRYHARGELLAALAACQESLRWAEIADDRPAMLTQELNIGALALTLGDWALAERSFQQAQHIAAALSDAMSGLQARLGLAQVRLRQDRFGDAQRAFEQALAEARGRDAVTVVVALNGLGLAQQALGQTPAAQAALAEAELLARAQGAPRLLAATLANQAALALRTGQVEAAGQALVEAVALDRTAENMPGLAHDLLLLAQVRRRQGEARAAQELVRQARTILQHTGQPYPLPGVDDRPAAGR